MKKHFCMVLAIVCFGFFPAYSQFIGVPKGPQFDDAMRTIFGKNRCFVADAVLQIKDGSGKTITSPVKVAQDSGNIFNEMRYSDVQGPYMNAKAITKLKLWGLDRVILIKRHDRKVSYEIFPGIQSYIEKPLPEEEAKTNLDRFKIKISQLGEEIVAGHTCIKNEMLVTDNQGNREKGMFWVAKDLRNFPVKIEISEQGREMTMLYKKVSFAKPAASLFEPPVGYEKFNNLHEMLQANKMKIQANAETNAVNNSVHPSKN